MTSERDTKLNTGEIAPSCTADMVKVAFCAWLSNDHSKQINANAVMTALNAASEQLQKRKIASVPIWEITKPAYFAPVYSNARDNKFFRIMDKKNYSAFMRDGQLYLKFLKTKPQFQSNSYATETALSEKIPFATSFTIKDAVLSILSEAKCAMSAHEIYNEIIKRGLYAFEAQNPINVVRTTIEYACDNSGYSNKDAVPCFHFDKNAEGKRVYSLLSTEQVESFITGSADPDDLPKKTEGNLAIWDDKVEQAFQKWLESENYAQRTAYIYRRAIAQIFQNFTTLAARAVSLSEGKLEAVRRYSALLNEDNSFVETNATRHNQFKAALAALERFYSVGIDIVDDKDDEQLTNPPEMINAPTSSLGNIVDLEEGKVGLREILEAHFQTLYGYSNISIVWNAAQDNLSLFLNDNAINTAEELWRFMYRVFLGEYVMKNPHIWKAQPNYPQSYVGVIINLVRQLGGTVTREQIDEYFARIKQGSPINATIIRQGYLAFYATKHFILTETVNLSSERAAAITKALDRLFERERVSCIVLRDISDDWFSTLPALKGNLNWTALLLQEALRLRPAVSYRTIFSGLNGQAYDTLGAAVVPSKSEIKSFADVVHRHCYENELLGKRMLSEDLRIKLREAGMLDGNELIYNLHKTLKDYRFAFTDENRMVKILER